MKFVDRRRDRGLVLRKRRLIIPFYHNMTFQTHMFGGLRTNRCCYSGFYNTYMTVMEKLPTEFFDRVRQIGFGHFLENANIVVNSYNLDDLAGCYIGNHEFQVKDKILKFTVEDIGHILGIPYSGSIICVGHEDETCHETDF